MSTLHQPPAPAGAEEPIPVIQPDGHATLATRRSYLRRQRRGRVEMALWAVAGLVLAWLGIIGLAGLTH